MSENNGIPKHWRVKKLGEECKCVTGTTPPKNESKNYGNDIPFVKPPQLFDKPINNAPEKLSNRGADLARVLPINSVLVTCIGNLGRTAINKIPVAFNQQINAIIPSVNIDGRFLFYQAQSPEFRNQLEDLSAATTVAIVNKGKFETIKISFPPLPEQRAIVAKIEELLSDLENGKQQLQTAQQQLKVYRQSLLKWAFEGLKEEKTIEEISEDHSIGLVRSSKDQNDIQKGVPYIKMNNVDLDGNVDFKKVVYVEVIPEEAKKYSLKKGDILINTRNSIELVGKTGVVREEKPNCVFNNNLLRIRTKQEYNSLFIGYQLIGPWLRKQMTREKKSTTNVCALYQRDIFPLKIKVANSKEQQLIVDELESKLTICDKLEETYHFSSLKN